MPYHDNQRGAIMILYMGAGSRSVKRSVMLTQGNISSVLSGNPRFGTAMTFVGLRNESTASFFVAVGATHDKVRLYQTTLNHLTTLPPCHLAISPPRHLTALIQ